MLKDRTKRLLAHELETMLAEMPLSKVHVKDLCERCGAQRQVFYYHFRDKYDLVAWIFQEDYRQGVEDAGLTGYRAQTAAALTRMAHRRSFYRKAFTDRSQNSIERHIQDFDVEMGIALAKRYLGAKELSQQQIFEIKANSYGHIGCTVEWLWGEIDATPEELAAWEFDHMPKFLRDAHEAAAQGRL